MRRMNRGLLPPASTSRAEMFVGMGWVLMTTAAAVLAGRVGAQPFDQCPPVGLDSSCGVLITVNPGGCSTIITPDPSQGPYDGADDTLTGVQNNSGAPLCSITLNQP